MKVSIKFRKNSENFEEFDLINLEIPDDATFDQLQQEIADRTGLAAEGQAFVYSGVRITSDEKWLEAKAKLLSLQQAEMNANLVIKRGAVVGEVTKKYVEQAKVSVAQEVPVVTQADVVEESAPASVVVQQPAVQQPVSVVMQADAKEEPVLKEVQ